MRPMTEVERQIETIRKLFATTQPCPRCKLALSIWRAGNDGNGFNPRDYNGHNGPDSFACPHCRARLRYLIPFIGPVFLWELVNPKWFRQSKEEGRIEDTDEISALGAAENFYKDGPLAMSNGKFETPFFIYANARDSLDPA